MDSDFKNAFPGIFNFTVGILLLIRLLIFPGPIVRNFGHNLILGHGFQLCYHSKDNIGLEWAGKYPPIIYDSLSTYCKLIRGPIGTQDSFLDYAEKDRYVRTGLDKYSGTVLIKSKFSRTSTRGLVSSVGRALDF